MTLKAKNIVENRFWIIENDKGERIGNIAQTSNGVRCTVSDMVEVFPSLDEMVARKGITIARKTREAKITNIPETDVYGYSTNHTPHNKMWNVQLKLPLYTKNEKSSSYFCAGYYIIKFDKSWSRVFTPKLITLQRYEYEGPFKTKIEQAERFKQLHETA
jgi:hypothetical protein